MDDELQLRTHVWTILNLFLLGDDPLLAMLREQALASEWTITLTGAGFRAYCSLPLDAPMLPDEPSFRMSDVGRVFPGEEHAVFYALFVKKGKLHLLEGVDTSGLWPDDFGRSFFGYIIPDGKLGIRDLDATMARIRGSNGSGGS
jgi:hypothetical protein